MHISIHIFLSFTSTKKSTTKLIEDGYIAITVYLTAISTPIWWMMQNGLRRNSVIPRPLSTVANASMKHFSISITPGLEPHTISSTFKMADMSDLELNQLRSKREDLIRVDTLCAANDIVSNRIHSLHNFKQRYLMDEKVLTDMGGHKLATSDSTIPANTWEKVAGYPCTRCLPTMSRSMQRISA